MTELILVGGQNSENLKKGEAWGAYKAGIIVRLNIDSGATEVLVEDSSRPDIIKDIPEIGTVYKAATLVDKLAFVCTTTELIVYDAQTWKEKQRISSPLFNDLHHVLPNSKGNYWVANTGLDNVIELDSEANVLNRYCTCAGEVPKSFADIDYRSVVSTKPHVTHPNYVFTIDNELYVTRFKQKDAICLTDTNRRPFQVRAGNIHDGLVNGDLLFFTSTNGWVTAFNIKSGAIELELDLNTLYKSKEPLGWCRGIEVLENGNLVVGFSRLRPTKFRENVDWVSKGIGFNKKLSPMATRVAIININERTIENEFCVEGVGMNAIFSIHLV